jgi:putative membrane protein
MLQQLGAAPQGRGFDAAYVALQLQGHQQLMAIQNGFLQAQPTMTTDATHIAMLARTTIEMHLTMLQELQIMIAS